MMWSLAALVIGFCIDLLVGDPHGFPHPVVLIGKCISVDRKSTRLNSSHANESRMPSSA